ncbi:MAG TPA: glycosyltransferase [Candidatus Dormibacteraeota bacterium]|nr:glycosyltransferase [Candidatus Dormibacteraeota bacterium]
MPAESPDSQGLTATIIIGTYNRRVSVLRVLEQLNQQTAAGRFEVVVAVDGASDGTEEAIAAGEWAFPIRWTVDANGGIAAARNRAARLAANPVLIVLDDDLLAVPNFVAAHLAAQERNGDVLVHGPTPLAAGFDRGGAALLFERTRALELDESSHTQREWTLWGGNFSVRRQLWRAIGGFDETFREYGGEDTDFGLRVAALGIRYVFEPAAVAYHLHRVSQASFRARALTEGRALVRLAAKHGRPIESFAGGSVRRPLDRLIVWIWTRSPKAGQRIGRLTSGILWLADRTAPPALQVSAARAVRRLHRLGGMTLERTPIAAGDSGFSREA